MGNVFKIRRGNGVPQPGDFVEYELAYDYSDNDLYVKVGSNMVKVNSEGQGTVTNVVAGNGLTGGGTSTATLDLDFSELTDMSGDISGTTEFILQNGTVESRKAASEIKLSAFNNDLSLSSGTVTSVTAGTGATQSGTDTVNPTINVVGENGLVASANAIGLDISTLATLQVNNLADEDLFALEVAVGGAIKKITASALKTYIGGGTITSVSNMSNDRILTASGGTTINGESNLTFTPSNNYLTVHEAGSSTGSHLRLATDNSDYIITAGGGSNQLSIYDVTSASNRLVINSAGAIATGVWQGTAIASAYLDADTAHLSTNQTFTGAKTFTGRLTISDAGADGLHLNQDTGATTNSNRLFFTGSATSAIFQEGSDLSFRTGATAGSSSGTERFHLNSSGLQINTGSQLYVDDIHGQSNGTNRLVLDDDTQSGIANGVSLTGVNHIYICADETNNGTGAIKFRKGTDNDLDSGTSVQLAEISNAGDLTLEQGSLLIPVAEKVIFGASNHTYISEDIDDRLRFFTGGAEFMRFTEGSSDLINLYYDTYFGDRALWAGGALNILHSTHGYISNTSGNLSIRQQSANSDIYFSTTNGSSTVNALYLDGSDAGTAVFNQDIRLETNATYIHSTDASGNKPRMFGMNSGNTTYIGPIDSYAGGSIIYGSSANVSSHNWYTDGSARMTLDGNVLNLPNDGDWFFIKNNTNSGGLRFGTKDGSGNYANQIEISNAGNYVKLNENTTVTGALTTTGVLKLQSELDFTGNGNKIIDVETLEGSNSFRIRNHNTVGNVFHDALKLVGNGGAHLYYNNSKKLETTNTGATISGNLTVTGSISGTITAGDATTLDGYDSSRFFRRQGSASATVGPGWMTVATNTSGRRAGEILVTDGDSGDHGFIRIHWLRSYADSNFTVINCGGHQNRITGVRVLSQDSDNTYGEKVLQVYVEANSSYDVKIFRMGDDAHYTDHTVHTPTIENTISGYSLHGNQLEDLNIYGFAHEEGIQAGGVIKTQSNMEAVNITASNRITAERIDITESGTVIGDIQSTDSTWLRLNQSTNKNIYTPRYIRADSGFFVDGASQGITGAGVFRAPNGSASIPTYSFSNDTNTGIYRYGADQLGFATGGTTRGFINSDGNWYNNANFIATTNGTGYAGRDTGGTVTTLIKASTGNFVEVGSSLALKFVTNGSSRYQIDTSGNHSIYGNTSFSSPMTVQYGAIINEGGHDSDTRIESDGDANMFRVDAGNNRIGISQGSPSYKLDVNGDLRIVGNGDHMIRFTRSGADEVSIEQDSSQLYFYNRTTSKVMFLMSENGNATLGYNSNPTLELRNTATSAGSGPSLVFGHSQGGTNSTGRISTYLTDGSQANRTGLMRFFHRQAGTEYLKLQLGDNYVRQYQKGDAGDYLETIVHDSSVEFHVASGNYVQISTDSGYCQIGPMNTSHNHIYTDRNSHYMNKPLYVLSNTLLNTSGNSYINNVNLGIGTSSPTKKLHVEGSTRLNGDVIVGPNNNNSKAFIKARNGYSSASTPDYTWYYNDQCGIFHPAGNVIGFSASGERARITANGLKVTSGALGVNIDPSTTNGRIDATNDVVAYSTSDKRLKENIKPIKNALDKIMNISGVSFDWKELNEEDKKTIHGNTGHDVGVIAQEIEEVLPEVVTERDNGYKAVKYEKLVPLLIEAMKQQQVQIDELKTKLGE